MSRFLFFLFLVSMIVGGSKVLAAEEVGQPKSSAPATSSSDYMNLTPEQKAVYPKARLSILESSDGKSFDPAPQVYQSKPLFELGIGAGSGYVQDYPGSDQAHLRTLALPIARYRGVFLRADEEESGARARVIQQNGFEFNISLSGSLPASSKDNTARSGMPDLDFTGEAGPSLNFYFIRRPTEKFFIGLPVRGIVSTDFTTSRYIGMDSAPEISYENFGVLCRRCRFGTSATVYFADRKVAGFFYDVEAAYVTPRRAAFDAKPGYFGAVFDQSVTWEWPTFTVGAGYSYSNLSGAANRQASLFRQNESLNYFVIVAWFFKQSEERERMLPQQ